MYYYHILSGATVTILTILFGVMSLVPLLTRPEDDPGAIGPLEFPERCCEHAARPRRVSARLKARGGSRVRKVRNPEIS